MTRFKELATITDSLRRLGGRKLAALGFIAVFVFLVTAIAGYLLSRPQFETLYTGLDKQDSTRVGIALREVNIPFDISADGSTLSVEYGSTTRARMLLAERGLPAGASSGYEIFDKIGSLGLTSFMQDITRVRALEGELARTIQAMQGVKAARVHLVLPEEGTFRRNRQGASASVVVRLATAHESSVAQAIRHLVAGSVPGMTIDFVTVLSADGQVLAAGADGENGTPSRAAKLEQTIGEGLQDNIRRTLAPMVGLRNLNVSVAVRLNTDKRQVNETIYNPDQRVERSVRVVRENQTAQNSSSQGATGVERNIPAASAKSGDGKQSNEENNKREELTNYEVSTKQISTTSGGYSIERLSAAILVNRAGLSAGLGDKANDAEALDKRINEIAELVTSAAGLMKERGDLVKVTAVNFADDGQELEPVAGPGFMQIVARQLGTILTAIAVLGGIFAIGLFVVRPVTQSFLAAPALSQSHDMSDMFQPNALPGAIAAPQIDFSAGAGAFNPPTFGLPDDPHKSGRDRLDDVVGSDEVRAAAVLKEWMREGAHA